MNYNDDNPLESAKQTKRLRFLKIILVTAGLLLLILVILFVVFHVFLSDKVGRDVLASEKAMIYVMEEVGRGSEPQCGLYKDEEEREYCRVYKELLYHDNTYVCQEVQDDSRVDFIAHLPHFRDLPEMTPSDSCWFLASAGDVDLCDNLQDETVGELCSVVWSSVLD